MPARRRARGVPLTFRSGGTSLSGQAGDRRRAGRRPPDFQDIEVLDDGRRVRVQPGVTVRQAQRPAGAATAAGSGPDPASEVACTIGGVVANNSSGHGLRHHREHATAPWSRCVFVLPSGTVVDTGARDADERLRAAEPELHAGLLALRDRVRRRPGVGARRSSRQFAMKNTMGYGLNALLDHDAPGRDARPPDRRQRGHARASSPRRRSAPSPVHAHAATGLLVFADAAPTRPTRCRPCVAAGARDRRADGRGLAARRAARPGLPARRCAALDVDAPRRAAGGVPGEDSAEQLARARGRRRGRVLGRCRLRRHRADHATPPSAADAVAPPQGPVRRRRRRPARRAPRPCWRTSPCRCRALAGTCDGLTGLFDRHGYADAVIFGHAKDGNIHFMLDRPLRRRAASSTGTPAFTDDMVDLVLAAGRHAQGRARHRSGHGARSSGASTATSSTT